jgi:hypothetical protein
VSALPRNISDATATLGAAIERFERRIAKAAARRSMRRRIGPPPPRLPSSKAHRPTRHRAALPRRYDRRPVRTVLGRRRAIEEGRRGGPSPVVAAVRRAGRRVADAVRGSLDALRRGLGRLRGRAGRR